VPQILRIVLRLRPHVARENGPLDGIVMRPLDARIFFELDFGATKSLSVRAAWSIRRRPSGEGPETRDQIHMNRLVAKQRVH